MYIQSLMSRHPSFLFLMAFKRKKKEKCMMMMLGVVLICILSFLSKMDWAEIQ